MKNKLISMKNKFNVTLKLSQSCENIFFRTIFYFKLDTKNKKKKFLTPKYSKIAKTIFGVKLE